jgi:hypothetical protein
VYGRGRDVNPPTDNHRRNGCGETMPTRRRGMQGQPGGYKATMRVARGGGAIVRVVLPSGVGV